MRIRIAARRAAGSSSAIQHPASAPPDDFPLDELVHLSGEATLGEGARLSGAEIKAWVNEGLIHSFYRAKVEKSDRAKLMIGDFKEIIRRMSPLAKVRREEIREMRVWASTHALSASHVNARFAAAGHVAEMPVGRRITIGP